MNENEVDAIIGVKTLRYVWNSIDVDRHHRWLRQLAAILRHGTSALRGPRGEISICLLSSQKMIIVNDHVIHV